MEAFFASFKEITLSMLTAAGYAVFLRNLIFSEVYTFASLDEAQEYARSPHRGERGRRRRLFASGEKC